MCLLDRVVFDDVGLVEEYGAGHRVCNAQRVCAFVVQSVSKSFRSNL